MTKLIVVTRNFSKAPKNDHDNSVCSSSEIHNFSKELEGVRSKVNKLNLKPKR
jgi:hypothetical protein